MTTENRQSLAHPDQPFHDSTLDTQELILVYFVGAGRIPGFG